MQQFLYVVFTLCVVYTGQFANLQQPAWHSCRFSTAQCMLRIVHDTPLLLINVHFCRHRTLQCPLLKSMCASAVMTLLVTQHYTHPRRASLSGAKAKLEGAAGLPLQVPPLHIQQDPRDRSSRHLKQEQQSYPASSTFFHPARQSTYRLLSEAAALISPLDHDSTVT